jgi:murein lipoprotein
MLSKSERKGGDYIMKKSLLVISMMLALAISIGGCATKGDIEQVQTREMEISAKADQAAQDAQEAKASADAAVMKANEAAARAEEAIKRAEERERIAAEKERIAEEKAKQAEAAFQKSMKK